MRSNPYLIFFLIGWFVISGWLVSSAMLINEIEYLSNREDIMHSFYSRMNNMEQRYITKFETSEFEGRITFLECNHQLSLGQRQDPCE